jgi:ferritin-like metal-binding protein YciE
MESIRDLLLNEMRDLYDAEKQLVKALPKVVKASTNSELKDAFAKHLEQTRGHVERLEQAFELMGEKAKGKSCAAMRGLLEEADQAAQEDMPEPMTDSGIICAAQKVEHYEISGYGTLSSWAKKLGLDEVAELLDKTLMEEKQADEKLTKIAGGILSQAASAERGNEQPGEMSSEEVDGGTHKKGSAQAGNGYQSRRRAV